MAKSNMGKRVTNEIVFGKKKIRELRINFL